MTQIVVNEGRHGAVAAVDLSAGECVIVNTDGKYMLADSDHATAMYAAASKRYIMVVLKTVASGVRVAAEQRKGYEVYAMVDGTTDVAVGDLLKVDTTAGQLVQLVAGTDSEGLAVAVALQARTADSAGLTKVMLL